MRRSVRSTDAAPGIDASAGLLTIFVHVLGAVRALSDGRSFPLHATQPLRAATVLRSRHP